MSFVWPYQMKLDVSRGVDKGTITIVDNGEWFKLLLRDDEAQFQFVTLVVVPPLET
jgi:hypothetical protein